MACGGGEHVLPLGVIVVMNGVVVSVSVSVSVGSLG